MDKYEYRIRAEEIKTLISQKKYTEAAKVADTIDWTRVKSVMMLCTVSDVYKVNRRFEDARLLLEMANERHPSGRMILYSLCDLAIRIGDVVQAIKYYKDFVQVAPNDSGRYVLQYKLYEAQDVGLEERIAVLEELKKRDYRERWAYELAYLYHRVGLETKCVEECDELILWFGDGKYVMKAMELKLLHQPLSPIQQKKFDAYMMRRQGLNVPDSFQDKPADREKNKDGDMDIQVKTMDVGKYNTINLQKELAESMRGVLQPGFVREKNFAVNDRERREPVYREPEEEAAAVYPEPEAESGTAYPEPEAETVSAYPEPEAESGTAYPEPEAETVAAYPEPEAETVAAYPEPKRKGAGYREQENSEYDRYLSQEYDGQISMVVPEERQTEKQITGQMNIEDILREWERTKKENEEKRRQELTQRMMEKTDTLLRSFDESSRKGTLERLQKEERIPVERRRQPEENVISARTKIWAAGEVENALRNAATAAAAEAAADTAVEAADAVRAKQEPAAAEPAQDVPGTDGRQEAEPQERKEQEEPEEEAVVEEPAAEEPAAEEFAAEEPDSEESVAEDEIPETDTDDDEKLRGGRDSAEESETADGGDEKDSRQDKEPQEEQKGQAQNRNMSAEEKKLFASFIPTKGAMRKLAAALDKLSLAAYTGNMILTGDPGSDMLEMARNVVKDFRAKDRNFSGKLARITGESLNSSGKDPAVLVEKLSGGALVVENAGAISREGMQRFLLALNQERWGILVIFTDTKRSMKKLLNENPEMNSFFNAVFHIEALDSATLVSYGCQYARMQEYAVDELGKLALHTRIEDMQTSDHIVTVTDVRGIVDEAIDHANRKTPAHFMQVLFARRYDEEDMIILHEGDFI